MKFDDSSTSQNGKSKKIKTEEKEELLDPSVGDEDVKGKEVMVQAQRAIEERKKKLGIQVEFWFRKWISKFNLLHVLLSF